MRRLRWVLPLLALTTGCWQPRYFAPREHQSGVSPSGDVAAFYDVQGGEAGATRGEVRVWSEGARARWNDADEEIVELHVGFELENNGTTMLELDVGDLRCEELYVDGLLQPQLAPAKVLGDGRAAPGSTTRVDLLFQPQAGAPRDIDGFAVRFAVQADQGAIVRQATPFGPERRRGYCGGYWGGYWGGFTGPWEPYGGWYWSVGYRPWGWGPGFGYPRYCR